MSVLFSQMSIQHCKIRDRLHHNVLFNLNDERDLSLSKREWVLKMIRMLFKISPLQNKYIMHKYDEIF